MITTTKLYVPVVTVLRNDQIKFLENMTQGFKRTISRNKYRSEITTQTENNNFDYLIDPTFENINRLFVLSFKNGNKQQAHEKLIEISRNDNYTAGTLLDCLYHQNYYKLIGIDL